MDLEEFRTKLFGMSGLATVEKAFELYSELEAENERLKGENLKHREDKMTMALKYNEVLNDLNDENENLKGELKQIEAQDQVVIDGLRKENAKLKCLALLYKREMYRFKTHFHTLEHTNRKRDFFSLLWKHTNESYRKAKKELMEGK